MSSQTPLTGIELISCAKASAASGPEAAARNCGYGDDVEQFRTVLQTACSDMGVEVDGVSEIGRASCRERV